jgi:hypothetical protein
MRSRSQFLKASGLNGPENNVRATDDTVRYVTFDERFERYHELSIATETNCDRYRNHFCVRFGCSPTMLFHQCELVYKSSGNSWDRSD